MKKKVFMAMICSLFLAACSSEDSKQESQKPEPPKAVSNQETSGSTQERQIPGVITIDWEKANQLAAAGGLFLDVRNPEEQQQGYVPGAVNIPMSELHIRMKELPKDRDILVYCRSGRRSEAASNLLLKRGFERVYNVAGGFLAYPQPKPSSNTTQVIK